MAIWKIKFDFPREITVQADTAEEAESHANAVLDNFDMNNAILSVERTEE